MIWGGIRERGVREGLGNEGSISVARDIISDLTLHTTRRYRRFAHVKKDIPISRHS